MKFSHGLSITVLALSFLSCSGGGGGSNSNPGTPESRTQALEQLPAEAKEYFLAWEARVFKSCDPSEAFGLRDGDEGRSTGVDGIALLNKNKGSPVFRDEDNLLILNGYNSESGMGNSKVEHSVNINGKVFSINAETKREGSNCKVYLYGQKVYETVIAESFTIGAHVTTTKKATLTEKQPVLRKVGLKNLGEAVTSGPFKLTTEVLRPGKEATQFLSRILELSEDEAGRLFKVRMLYTPSSIRLGDESSVWTTDQDESLVADYTTLSSLFDGTAKSFALEIRLKIPEMKFIETSASSNDKNYLFIVNADIQKKEDRFTFSAQGVDLIDLMSPNEADARVCAQGRVDAYLNSAIAQNKIDPSVSKILDACKVIDPSVEAASYKNNFLKTLVPKILRNVTPTPQLDYSGWATVLSHFALEALEKGEDVTTYVDPSRSTVIVPAMGNYLQDIRRDLESSRNLETLKQSAYEMGIEWALRGSRVSTTAISEIIHSLDNTAVTFEASTQRMFYLLAEEPGRYGQELRFAANVDESLKNEAIRAQSLAKQLSYADFEDTVFNRFIQVRPSMEDLKEWISRFTVIKAETDKYPAIAPVKGELVGLSIKWLRSEEIGAQDLAGIYASVSNVIGTFGESTKKLLRDMNSSYAESKESLDFSMNLSSEYKQHALSIKEKSKAVGYESWGETFFDTILQKKPSLKQVKEWDDLWTSTIDFTNREKARVSGEFGSSPEWNRKKVIEMAIAENWGGRDYSALETIAAVAKIKNTCDRYKDASSQADCIGIRRFSKSQGMFLDPAFGDRYVNLGREFTNHLNKLSASEWTTLRWSIVGEFVGTWEPIWSKCDAPNFNQKAVSMNGLVVAIVKETNTSRKWELERQIKDNLKNCQ